jgi:hypothetical protein
MEIAIAITSIMLSIVGGGCGGIAAIFKLSKQLDDRFDTTDRKILELAHRYDVQAANDRARVELLEYRLAQSEQAINHKFSRCENAILQLSKFLEKSQGYHPRSTFPLNNSDDD